jgi:diguanylate cyclase (GGDEF)-like protein
LLGPAAIADLLDRRAPRKDVIWALAFVGLFAVLMLVAVRFGDVHGPTIAAFGPISATLVCVGDLLTAYFLLSQFKVNGVRAFAVLGAAFGISGGFTILYIAFFPGVVLVPPLTMGLRQVSSWAWISWHLSFPLIVGTCHFIDRDTSVRISGAIGIRRWLIGTIAVATAACCLVAAIIVGDRNQMPLIDVGGFTNLFQTTIGPTVAAINVIAAISILWSPHMSKLRLWLGVALLIEAMDATMNSVSSGGRYTIPWYVGKFETLATAGVVLAVLLSEVTSLYARLSTLATIDALTGLSNRQAFDTEARFALVLQQRRSADVAFLVIDIDFFKQFNDTYGHQLGDVCLKQVAHCIRKTCSRSIDLVGRFGGEEFVVLLQGTNAFGAVRVGEAIRSCVEELGIAHAASAAAPVVTVSVGITQSNSERDTHLETLFQRADAALYRAKRSRNTVVMDDDAPNESPRFVAQPV